MYYVSMTDKFLSGWGKADGKINKLVLECDSMGEATTVEINAKDRSEMKDIAVHGHKPHFNTKKYHTTYHGKPDYKRWYSPDRPFKKAKQPI